VIDPLFWLGLSILLVTVSLTTVLVAAIPALQELARAARSAEKFFDTLSRELPATLNAIRDTSIEITDLTEDVSEGVKSAGQVVKQFDQSLDNAKKQAESMQIGTRSVFIGFKAAWKSFTRQKNPRKNTKTLANPKPNEKLPKHTAGVRTQE
jgi:deoxyribodipyrimidine photolyase